jgi:hypothetical protein
MEQGQLPDKEGQMYHDKTDDLYLFQQLRFGDKFVS